MRYTSRDPATGRWLGSVPAQSLEDARATLQEVSERQTLWAKTPLAARLATVAGIADALGAHREALAEQVCLEVGKPLREARAEVDKCIRLCHLVVEMAPGVLRERHLRLDTVDAWVEPVPLGVLLAVMPWNYPLWQALRCIVPQLAAGNGVLLKPAPSVFRSSRAVVDVVLAVNPHTPTDLVWTDNDGTVALIGERRVRGAVCVGGTAAGRAVGRAAGEALKKCVLELGGNDAYVVLAGADLDAAAAVCVTSRLKNGGQACLSAKRIIVQDAIYDDFLARLISRVEALRPGAWSDEDADFGPLASAAGMERLAAQVEASVSAGARVVLDGGATRGPGLFYAPVLLAEVPLHAPAFTEELFGPVFSVSRAPDAETALQWANQSPFALGAALFAAPGEHSLGLARDHLRAGTVALNGPATSDPRLPFGGLGDSGHGVELGEEGLLEFTARRVVRAPRTARAPLRLDRTDHHFELPAPVVDALRRGSVADLADSDAAESEPLRQALADALGRPDLPSLVHGAEDALLKRLLWGRGLGRDTVVLPVPCWPVVGEMAERLGYSVVQIPHERTATGFQTPIHALRAALEQHPRAVVVLGTPNNPTGHATPLAVVEDLLQRFPDAAFLLDAVYSPLDHPVWRLPADDRRVCVVGSFSSQLGLPGIRLGFAVGDTSPAMATTPGLNPAAVRAATVALAARARIAGDIERARTAARRLGHQSGPGWQGCHTEAPFVLVEVTASEAKVDAAIETARVVPGRWTWQGRRYLRWMLGPQAVVDQVEQCLDLLGPGR
jgi:succinate-semialdehyde dehydrogenase/glutarate-semialdehyde dehydrogenase